MMLSPKNKLNPAFREINLLRINANLPSQNQKNQKNRSNRVFPLTFRLVTKSYLRIALGLAQQCRNDFRGSLFVAKPGSGYCR